MQPEQTYLVPGRLVDQQKILHEVELVIVTKRQLGQRGEEDEVVSEIKLARRSPVPDGGPYTLRYVFNERKQEEQICVRQGMLIRA